MVNSRSGLVTQPTYTLDNLTVNRLIPKGRIGVYMLFKLVRGVIRPYYVGRSDTCLRRRLTRHPHKSLDFFQFTECESIKKAYLLERHLFWRIRPPLNIAFPNQPACSRKMANNFDLSALKLSQGEIHTFSLNFN
jgi:hypothetical protein